MNRKSREFREVKFCQWPVKKIYKKKIYKKKIYIYNKQENCLYISKPWFFLAVAKAKFRSVKGASYHLDLRENYQTFYSHNFILLFHWFFLLIFSECFVYEVLILSSQSLKCLEILLLWWNENWHMWPLQVGEEYYGKKISLVGYC